MSYKLYLSLAVEEIEIRFLCSGCNKEVLSKRISVPHPNCDTSTSSESIAENEGKANCIECKKDFRIKVFVSIAGAWINILDSTDDSILEIIEYPSPKTVPDNTLNSDGIVNSLSVSCHKLRSLKDIIELNTDTIEQQKTLYATIFSSTLLCLEHVLLSNLLKKIQGNDKLLPSFINLIPHLKKQTFELGEMFECYNYVRETVIKELKNINYLDLKRVACIYKSTLNVELPLSVRFENMVNNYLEQKEQNLINCSNSDILSWKHDLIEFLDEVETFIITLDEQISFCD